MVLGPTGVGKTVYLGMLLDLLSRGVGGLQGLSRSPYSLTLHRNLILALQRQRFPEKTPLETDRWNWLHCEILGPRGKGAADIVTPDVAGEAVMSEMENPGTNKTIRALISRCAGMVVLVDLVEVVADGQSQELFAMQLISYLDALRREGRSRASWRCQWPLYSPRLISSRNGSAIPSCSRGNVSSLHAQCQARLEQCSFYCSGVAGSSAKLVDDSGQESLVPLRVEPRGIVEPFAWMVSKLG